MDDKWYRDILVKIDATQNAQAITLTKLTSEVAEHIRRTEILEEELKPIKSHVSMFSGVAKAVFLIGALIALLKNLRPF